MSFDVQITVINAETRMRVLDHTHWSFDEFGVGGVLRSMGDDIQSGEITLGRRDKDVDVPYDETRPTTDHLTARTDAKGKVRP